MILLATILATAAAPDNLPLIVELHPAGLAATAWLMANPSKDADGNSAETVRLVQLEIDAAWRLSPTASVVASLSTYPWIRADVDHFSSTRDRGHSRHEVFGLALDAGFRRHAETLHGLCFDVLATAAHRAYRASYEGQGRVSEFDATQWRFGLLGKPGVQWTWGRFSARAGLGFGLEWASTVHDSVLASWTETVIGDDGSVRSSGAAVRAMAELPAVDGGVQPQGEVDFALGWMF